MWRVASLLYPLFLQLLQNRQMVQARPIPPILTDLNQVTSDHWQRQGNLRRDYELINTMNDYDGLIEDSVYDDSSEVADDDYSYSGDEEEEEEKEEEQEEEEKIELLLSPSRQVENNNTHTAERISLQSDSESVKGKIHKDNLSADGLGQTYHAAYYGDFYRDCMRPSMPIFPNYYRRPPMPMSYMQRAYQPTYPSFGNHMRYFPPQPPNNYQRFINEDEPMHDGYSQQMKKPPEESPKETPKEQQEDIPEVIIENPPPDKDCCQRPRVTTTPFFFMALSKLGEGSLIVIRKVSKLVGMKS